MPGIAVLALAATVAGCSGHESPTTPAAVPPESISPEAQVHSLSIQLAGGTAADTIVTLADKLPLTARADDKSGRAVSGVAVRWASADTTAATIEDDGTLLVRRSGRVILTATAGEAVQEVSFTVIRIDGAAVRDIVEDPFVARLVGGLTPIIRERVRGALAASSAALAAGEAPTLRTLGANVANALHGADDPADRTVLSTLELYVRQLERVLTLPVEG